MGLYQCSYCLDKFSTDEVKKVNCNGNIESFDDYEYENNCQNPDWCVDIVCEECEKDLGGDESINTYDRWCDN